MRPATAYDASEERRPLPRAARLAIAVVLAAWPLYFVVANVLLTSGAVTSLVNSGESVHIEFDSAHSLYPGHVSLKGFKLRLNDKNVQALLELPRADVRIALSKLTSRTFHATRVRGTSARFYFRHKIEKVDESNVHRVAAFPRIPGLDPIPLSEAGPVPAISTVVKKLWSVELEDVESSVDELWFQEYRYRGRGYVKGGFRLEPLQRVRVGPASLELEPGTLTTEPHVVATDVTTRLDFTVHPFAIPENVGAAPLRHVEAKGTVSARLEDLGVLALYLGGGSKAPIAGKTAQLRVESHLVRGAFEHGSALHLDVAELSLRPEKGKVGLDGPLSMSVTAPRRGELVAGVDSAKMTMRVATKDGERPALQVTGLSARARFDAADLSEGAVLKDGKVNITADAQELRDVFSVFGVSAIRDGRAAITGEATVDRETIRGSIRTDFEGLELSTDQARLRADGFLQALATAPRSLGSVDVTDLKLESSRVAVRSDADGSSRSTWLKLRVPRGRVVPGLTCASFGAEVQAGNAAALASFVEVGPLRAAVSAAAKGSGVYARARTTVEPSRVQVDLEHASVGDVEGRGLLIFAGQQTTGAIGFEAGGLTTGIDLQPSGPRVKPFASWDWLDGRIAVLRSSGAATSGADPAARGRSAACAHDRR